MEPPEVGKDTDDINNLVNRFFVRTKLKQHT